jgi:hypothetical protein
VRETRPTRTTYTGKYRARTGIKCCGSVTFGTDSDPRIRITNLRIRIRILLFSSVADKKLTKKKFIFFIAYCFLKVHLYQSSYIKTQKRSHKLVKSRFFLTFLLVDGGIRNRTNSDGSGSGRPKNIRILRIRIRIYDTGTYKQRNRTGIWLRPCTLYTGGDRTSSGCSEACDAMTVSAQTLVQI